MAQKNNKRKNLFSNVGYWVVVGMGFWVQIVQADVRVVTTTTGSYAWTYENPYPIASWCPGGYVLTGCNQRPNTSVNPTGCLGNGVRSDPGNGGDGQIHFPTVIAICAKVCN